MAETITSVNTGDSGSQATCRILLPSRADSVVHKTHVAEQPPTSLWQPRASAAAHGSVDPKPRPVSPLICPAMEACKTIKTDELISGLSNLPKRWVFQQAAKAQTFFTTDTRSVGSDSTARAWPEVTCQDLDKVEFATTTEPTNQKVCHHGPTPRHFAHQPGPHNP